MWVAMTMAGCAEAPPPIDAGEDATDDPAGATEGIPAPSWALGDHWTFRPTDGEPVTFVVAEDLGEDWRMRTTDAELAFSEQAAEARPDFDISTLGAIRKSDLAGSQGADRVKHFDFPLVAGKEWTTPWDGQTFDVRVVDADNDTARLEGSMEGRVVYDYTYDRSVGWFREFNVLAPDGTVVFGFVDVVRGANFTGELPSWAFEVVVDIMFDGTAMQQGWLEVTEETTDVFLDLSASCAAEGAAEYAIGPPQGLATGATDGYEYHGACPHTLNVTGSIGQEPRGAWGYLVSGSSDDWDVRMWAATRILSFDPFPAE